MSIISNTLYTYTCDRCKAESSGNNSWEHDLKPLFSIRSSCERLDSFCNHVSVGDLCPNCWREFMKFMGKESEDA